jgi:hypothetical protein
MTIEYISAQLKDESQRFSRETLSLNPYDTANYLLLCGKILLQFIKYSNQQIEPDSQAFFSKSDIDKIEDLFRELGNNFFPMAHTDEPLRNLRIVNTQQYENLNTRIENFIISFTQTSEDILRANIGINERNNEFSHAVLAQLEDFRTEIRDVLNP